MTATPRTTKTATMATATQSPAAAAAAASRYQQLRSHLAELKLHAAAEALPACSTKQCGESVTDRGAGAAAEHRGRRQHRPAVAGRLRFACLSTPATLADFDVDAPESTAN